MPKSDPVPPAASEAHAQLEAGRPQEHPLDLAHRTIVHVATIPRVLIHFRLPILREHQRRFGRVVLYCSDGKDLHLLHQEGFEVHLGTVTNGIGWQTVPEILKLWRFLRANRVDVLVGHQPMGALVGVLAGWLARVPVRFYSTGGLKHVPHRHDAWNRLMELGELQLIRFTDATLCVNREDEQRIRRVPGIADRAVYIGPTGGSGVNLQTFSPEVRWAARDNSRADLGLDADVWALGYAGRCVWEKGFRELVQAVRQIVPHLASRRLCVVILGEGPDLAAFRQLTEDAGIARLFAFPGYRHDIAKALSGLDAFVLPSFREGVSVALLQAQALGIPSIATNIRGNRDLIEHGVTGQLVPLRDAGALAAAILSFLREPQVAAAMGTRAARTIAESFDERRLVPRTLALMADVMARKLAPATAALEG